MKNIYWGVYVNYMRILLDEERVGKEEGNELIDKLISTPTGGIGEREAKDEILRLYGQDFAKYVTKMKLLGEAYYA